MSKIKNATLTFEDCCNGADVVKITTGKRWTFNLSESHEIATKIEYKCAGCGRALRIIPAGATK